jgi:uncharacterized protein YjiS (DUF1127 family)
MIALREGPRPASAERRRPSLRPGEGLLALIETVARWRDRRRQRRALMRLDDQMLADIGLDRCQAWQEYRKPCWRA